MKQLLLFRHAKSDWDKDFSQDHQRPLAPRGIKAAKLMGQWLSLVEQVPSLVLCSTAVRARQTLELAVQAGQWHCKIEYSESLYLSTPSLVLQVIHQLPQYDRIMLVGHEPTWSELVAELSGARIHFPTAAICCLQSDVFRWQEIHQAILRWHVTPKLLKKSIRNKSF